MSKEADGENGARQGQAEMHTPWGNTLSFASPGDVQELMCASGHTQTWVAEEMLIAKTAC